MNVLLSGSVLLTCSKVVISEWEDDVLMEKGGNCTGVIGRKKYLSFLVSIYGDGLDGCVGEGCYK